MEYLKVLAHVSQNGSKGCLREVLSSQYHSNQTISAFVDVIKTAVSEIEPRHFILGFPLSLCILDVCENTWFPCLKAWLLYVFIQDLKGLRLNPGFVIYTLEIRILTHSFQPFSPQFLQRSSSHGNCIFPLVVILKAHIISIADASCVKYFFSL